MKDYGFENFKFEILEDNIQSKKKLDERERFFILKYKSYKDDFGYNVEMGGSGKGKHPESVKEKISKAQIGEKNHMYGKTGYKNPTSKQVIDLTSGKIYGSACEASRILKLCFSHICSVAFLNPPLKQITVTLLFFK